MTARVVTTTRKELSKQIVNPGTYYYAYNAFKISMNICHFLESLYNHITSVIFLDYILLIFKKEVPRFNFVVNFENNIHIKMVPIHSVSWNHLFETGHLYYGLCVVVRAQCFVFCVRRLDFDFKWMHLNYLYKVTGKRHKKKFKRGRVAKNYVFGFFSGLEISSNQSLLHFCRFPNRSPAAVDNSLSMKVTVLYKCQL